jgi:hypothetical protein
MRVLFSAHACISFMRRRASSKSSAGVFCVFLMNPCTTPIRSPWTKNSNRATRRLGSPLRTSQSPWPSGRHSGIPTGQPHCTVARSVPITRRSSGGRVRSHSITGSAPPDEGNPVLRKSGIMHGRSESVRSFCRSDAGSV